jgi:hypothetical protein
MLAGSLVFAAVAGASTPSQAVAQEASTVPADRHDDNGFDKGWFGLIGLAGLLGLKRREDVRDRDATRNDAGRSASARV